MRRVAVYMIICFAILLGFSGRGQDAHARTNASPSSPFQVTRSGNTYTAASQSTPSSYTGTLKSVMTSAVTELNSGGGGIVNFTAGTFDFGSEYFKVDDQYNITYQGAGMNATILQNNSSASVDTEVFNFGGAFNVVIRDMSVLAGGPVRSTSDAIDLDYGNDSLVENVKILGARGRGIVFDGKNIINGVPWTSERNTVRNCVIDGVPYDGIEFLAASNNVVEGCTITNVGYHGIQATKSSTSASGQKNKKSSDNIIRNNVIDNAGRDGVNINAGDRNRIEGNQITNSGNVASGSGIKIQSADSIACDDNVVENNVATDNQPTKTQRYGLNISHALCNRTVVGSTNNFAGNLTKPINDAGTNTQYAPDTTPPSVPQNLSATAIDHARIDLSWTASTDNTAVGSYTIRRDGSFLASVGGATTTYSDTSVQPSTSYSYTVEALDTSNNPSGQSSPPATATTPALPPIFTVNPVADAYVNETSASTNYGSASTLKVDGSPINRSYLRFVVQAGGGAVTHATLRVFANSASSIGHTASRVANNTWGETTINYTNAPALGTAINASGPFSAGTWVEVDVTPYVTGNGTYTLALTTSSSTSVTYGSRTSANAPQLVVETGAPDTQPPTVPDNVTATAINHARVDVSWSASLDNVGVHHYTIRRNGQILTSSVSGAATTYSDLSVQPSTLYSYTVEAFDAAGNPSGESSPPALATTPPAPGPDVTPPSVPGNVAANAFSYQRIDLSWTGSTDNVAVDHYTIRRGGLFLAQVGAGTTNYSDTPVQPSTTYSYTVEAVDTSNNPSGQSTPPASATTPAAPSSFTFTPDVDSYVNEASASTNYGNSTTLRVDGSPLVRSYLRFTVQGLVGTVTQVTLRVFANSASSTGHEARGVGDITWNEGTINFTNAPAFGSVINSTGPFSAGAWVDVNVTSYITGNGTYSLALTGPGSTAVSYASSESANAPQLIVQVS